MSTLALQQERDKRTGVIVTIVFHILLSILFLYFGLEQPNPPLQEVGIEIAMADFGTSTTGKGNTENPNPGEQQASAAAVAARNTAEEVATDENSEVVVPKPEKPKKPAPNPSPKPDPKPQEKPKEPTPFERMMQNVEWGKGGGGGDGTDKETGNVGTPTGKPDGIGTFHGDGWSLSIGGGRSPMGKPVITDKPTEGGRVVVNFTVDKSGRVTSVTHNLGKSTTTSQVLFNLVKNAVQKIPFSPDPNATTEQRGEMTFVFILE
jgi:periplasmic protein TonB